MKKFLISQSSGTSSKIKKSHQNLIKAQASNEKNVKKKHKIKNMPSGERKRFEERQTAVVNAYRNIM